jgi:hypothetical protein
MTCGVASGNPRRQVAARIFKAVHGVRAAARDPQFELELATNLGQRLNRERLPTATPAVGAQTGATGDRHAD